MRHSSSRRPRAQFCLTLAITCLTLSQFSGCMKGSARNPSSQLAQDASQAAREAEEDRNQRELRQAALARRSAESSRKSTTASKRTHPLVAFLQGGNGDEDAPQSDPFLKSAASESGAQTDQRETLEELLASTQKDSHIHQTRGEVRTPAQFSERKWDRQLAVDAPAGSPSRDEGRAKPEPELQPGSARAGSDFNWETWVAQKSSPSEPRPRGESTQPAPKQPTTTPSSHPIADATETAPASSRPELEQDVWSMYLQPKSKSSDESTLANRRADFSSGDPTKDSSRMKLRAAQGLATDASIDIRSADDASTQVRTVAATSAANRTQHELERLAVDASETADDPSKSWPWPKPASQASGAHRIDDLLAEARRLQAQGDVLAAYRTALQAQHSASESPNGSREARDLAKQLADAIWQEQDRQPHDAVVAAPEHDAASPSEHDEVFGSNGPAANWRSLPAVTPQQRRTSSAGSVAQTVAPTPDAPSEDQGPATASSDATTLAMAPVTQVSDPFANLSDPFAQVEPTTPGLQASVAANQPLSAAVEPAPMPTTSQQTEPGFSFAPVSPQLPGIDQDSPTFPAPPKSTSESTAEFAWASSTGEFSGQQPLAAPRLSRQLPPVTVDTNAHAHSEDAVVAQETVAARPVHPVRENATSSGGGFQWSVVAFIAAILSTLVGLRVIRRDATAGPPPHAAPPAAEPSDRTENQTSIPFKRAA